MTDQSAPLPSAPSAEALLDLAATVLELYAPHHWVAADIRAFLSAPRDNAVPDPASEGGTPSMEEAELMLSECRQDNEALSTRVFQLERELAEERAKYSDALLRLAKAEAPPSASGAPIIDSKERQRERFEQWFKMTYPLFRESAGRDTTIKHQLWTAWQVANLPSPIDSGRKA